MKLCWFFVFCGCLIGPSFQSAIPMWEFLSKQEKMSYLYSMFANQVDEFCENAKINNCNQELLKYGLNKLKVMPEDHLDIMDPYQRGANNIIWDSMMEGHAMMKSTSTTSTTTAKPNSYEDDSFAEFGAASAKIDNIYRVPPPKGFVYHIESGTPQYIYPNLNKPKNGQQNGQYVVKVYPDGRPVYDGTRQPQDDDLRHYQLSKVKIPNF